MTILFNSRILPPNPKMTFGFVQSRYSPQTVSDFDETLPKCTKCKTKQFPLKNGKFACPICSPESDFVEGSLKIGEGFETRSLFYFAFDINFSIDKIQMLLKSLSDSMSENDVAVILSLSPKITILSLDNTIPFFTVLDKINDFTLNDSYELTKDEINNFIIPSLFALYSMYSEFIFKHDHNFNEKNINNIDNIDNTNKSNNTNLNSKEKLEHRNYVDIIPLIQILIRQSEKRPFATFCFLNSPVAPLTVEKAAAASRTITSNGGIIHFGASESFKRLTAISRLNFGCVFGISENLSICSLTIQKLINLSRPSSIKLISPRFVEVEKVTGSEGSMNMTAYITKMNLKSIRGCSARLTIDQTRIGKSHEKIVKMIEITDNIHGRFISLHNFTFPQNYEEKEKEEQQQQQQQENPIEKGKGKGKENKNEIQKRMENIFIQYSNQEITNNIILKGFASDILRSAWAGEEWNQLIEKHVNNNGFLKEILSSYCTLELGLKPDQDALRLFYILESLHNDNTNRLIHLENGRYILVSPPIAYIYSNETFSIDIINRKILSEWPFELRFFTDLTIFKCFVEKFGCKLE
ncbi:hypothetical protein TRFO_38770 [Tritrichomonas foetus]|uniref:Uncharacterized protein n=1 Tax=Tritrichomonas foetus TaxID=1144522 RepID=A0A1J4J748_9EUKA|nr:hypothetical protein TRFO_38770 [Tritrichomonas foetus]|eukprot:OHS95054.1 hypothetical protein TRFO_38770 [Tritrichomonas foetus]